MPHFQLQILYALYLICTNTNIPTMVMVFNSHDCGVFVMIYMDVLALTSRMMCFD